MECDFCSSPNPTRKYDAGSEIRLRSFVESGPQVGPEKVFSRVWAACETCGAMIDAGRIDELKDSVMVKHTFYAMNVIPARMFDEWQALQRQMLSALYDELKKRQLVRTA